MINPLRPFRTASKASAEQATAVSLCEASSSSMWSNTYSRMPCVVNCTRSGPVTLTARSPSAPGRKRTTTRTLFILNWEFLVNPNHSISYFLIQTNVSRRQRLRRRLHCVRRLVAWVSSVFLLLLQLYIPVRAFRALKLRSPFPPSLVSHRGILSTTHRSLSLSQLKAAFLKETEKGLEIPMCHSYTSRSFNTIQCSSRK